MTTSATPAAVAHDEAAVRRVPARIMAAWAEHDADAFAETFTEDGTLILPGLFLNGREEIRSYMGQAFAGPYRGTRVTGTPTSTKYVGSGVVLVLTQGGVLAPGESEVSAERAIRASWLLAKRGEEWLITAYQNTPLRGPDRTPEPRT
jgi:uncharacterized protein (TIGR02246 family)